MSQEKLTEAEKRHLKQAAKALNEAARRYGINSKEYRAAKERHQSIARICQVHLNN